MNRIEINLNNPEDNKVDKILEEFKKKSIVIYPTDTIYGLGCIATDAGAVKRIYNIKKRDLSKSLIVLTSDIEMVEKYCFLNEEQKRYVQKELAESNPTTFILKSKDNLPKEINSGLDSLAIRIPKNDFLQKLLMRLEKPIISTSVNISGQEDIGNDLNKIEEYFTHERPDWIVDAGELPVRSPSRIVDIREIESVKVLRG